jgi:hypothetical protein
VLTADGLQVKEHLYQPFPAGVILAETSEPTPRAETVPTTPLERSKKASAPLPPLSSINTLAHDLPDNFAKKVVVYVEVETPV